MADVFISYSKKDRALAERVDGALREAGYTTWWDDNLIPAEQWNQTIVAEIAAAGTVLVIWTDSAIASSFVLDEAEAGRRANKLVPVRFADVEPPFGQGSIQLADLRGWHGGPDDPRWQQVLTAIGRTLQGAGMQKAASLGGAFARRLTDILPSSRKHVPPPSPSERWVKECEFTAKYVRNSDGLDFKFYAIGAETERTFGSGRPEAIVFFYDIHTSKTYTHCEAVWRNGTRAIEKRNPPIRSAALLSDGKYMARILASNDDNVVKLDDFGRSNAISNYLKAELLFDKNTVAEAAIVCDECNQKILYTLEPEVPLLVVPAYNEGPVKVFEKWNAWEGEIIPPKLVWSGGIVEGRNCESSNWSVDLSYCLIGVNRLGNYRESYLLSKHEQSYDCISVPCAGSTLALHPSGLLVRLFSRGRDMELPFKTQIPWRLYIRIVSRDWGAVTISRLGQILPSLEMDASRPLISVELKKL